MERSVSGISYSQERRSLGWRREDPSRKFLIPRRGGHWAGGGKIRLENFLFPGEAVTGAGGGKIRLGVGNKERRSLGWRWKDPSRKFLIPRRGGHWAGDGKIRLENVLFPGEAVTGLEVEKSVSKISFPGEAVTGLEVERSVSKISYSQERRSLGWRWKDPSRKFLIPRRGGHWAGGGKIRLENFLFPGEAVTGLEVERSVSEWKIHLGNKEGEAVTGLEVERSVSKISHSQERRSLGRRWKDPSRRSVSGRGRK